MKNKILLLSSLLVIAAAAFMIFGGMKTDTKITYKSAKSTSSYYQMGVQISEAMKKSSDGTIFVTVEESQGSVQNVKDVVARKGNYVFTTPPVLVKLAIAEKAMFKGKGNPRFSEIRALFPIPSLTMHFVMSKESGVNNFEDMAGKKILLGKGSFGAKEGAKYLKKFGLDGKVTLANVELSNAVPALKNGQIDGFVTAGSYPAPNVIEAASSVGVKVISLSDEQIKISKRTKLIIPAGTYSGQSSDITTTSLPVVTYTTTDMSDDVAYKLTKTYWDSKKMLGNAAKWWNGVSADMISNISTKIHPGALKYYKEIGAKIVDHHN